MILSGVNVYALLGRRTDLQICCCLWKDTDQVVEKFADAWEQLGFTGKINLDPKAIRLMAHYHRDMNVVDDIWFYAVINASRATATLFWGKRLLAIS